jgi:hypothetical protein
MNMEVVQNTETDNAYKDLGCHIALDGNIRNQLDEISEKRYHQSFKGLVI